MDLKCLAFPINTDISNPFSLKKPSPHVRYPVNWSARTFIILSQSLSNQIWNERTNIEMIRGACLLNDEGQYDNFFTVLSSSAMPPNTDDPTVTEIHFEPNKFLEVCKNLQLPLKGYFEVYSRDTDVFSDNVSNKSNKFWAVVLIFNGEYYGHIYAWVTNNNHIYTIGIRNRSDSKFLPPESALSNVSGYLLEGVIKLGQHLGKQNIVVVGPKPIMAEKILPKFGFVDLVLSDRDVQINRIMHLSPLYSDRIPGKIRNLESIIDYDLTLDLIN